MSPEAAFLLGLVSGMACYWLGDAMTKNPFFFGPEKHAALAKDSWPSSPESGFDHEEPAAKTVRVRPARAPMARKRPARRKA